jgi:hypothetical protein
MCRATDCSLGTVVENSAEQIEAVFFTPSLGPESQFWFFEK